jgi:hypothetical protein
MKNDLFDINVNISAVHVINTAYDSTLCTFMQVRLGVGFLVYPNIS